MTAPSLVAVASALALVLAAIALMARMVRGSIPGMRRRADGATLEVLHRIGLAPRQGVAVVRVGSRSALVSFGDGGVSLLLELDPQELSGHESAGNEHAAHVRAYPRSADHDLTGHERAGHDLTDHGLAGNDRPNGHTESDPGWGDCYDASGRAAAFADAVGGIGSRRALPGDFAPDGGPSRPRHRRRPRSRGVAPGSATPSDSPPFWS